MTLDAAPMRRCLVIGCAGAGKSTLAREIAAPTGLPLIHLDQLYWSPGWIPTPPGQWEEVVRQSVQQPRWVMDGNYGGTMELFTRVLKRRVLGRRADALEGCPERLTRKFFCGSGTIAGPGVRRFCDSWPEFPTRVCTSCPPAAPFVSFVTGSLGNRS